MLQQPLDTGGARWLTLGFVVGGIGYAVSRPWAADVLVGTALVSSTVLVVMWDGQFDRLVEKGVLGLAINFGVGAWLLVW